MNQYGPGLELFKCQRYVNFRLWQSMVKHVPAPDLEVRETYALANSYSANGAVVNLPSLSRLANIQVTNSTYAAISMRDGDSFAKKFGGGSGDDPDFFAVTFTGFEGFGATGNVTGNVKFYLADLPIWRQLAGLHC